MPKICLNMIVKNETAIIERCLAAAAPHIDCYAICDTGSTDGTEEMIQDYFRKRNIPGIVPKTTFRNFEQARNEALDAARSSPLDFDYILLCDADMELVVKRPNYRDELTSDAYLVTQRTANSGLEYDNIRLVRRQSPSRYKGVTHEFLDMGAAAAVRFDGISYIDHATGSNRENKFRRDVELLLQGLKDEPDNARYVFYLGNSYFDMDDFTNALAAYRRRASMGGWEEEVFYSNYRMGLALGRLGREAEMIQQLLATFEKYPHRAEPLHALALHYQRSSQNRLAFHTAEIGRSLPAPVSALFVEQEVYRWRLTDIVSVSLYWMGRFKESIDLCNRLLDIVPESQRARILKNREWSEKGVIASQSAAVVAGQGRVPDRENHTPYTTEFMSAIASGSRQSAMRILPIAFELVCPRSVIDLGCGPGAWLNACRQLGVEDVVGVDGDYVQVAQLEIPASLFVPVDLPNETPASLAPRLPGGPRRFDLAMSLEVAEHLPPAAGGGFVDLLCSLAPVVLFSAAIPFQGGTNHLHECFPSFWQSHFARHGYLAIDAVRARVWDDQNVEWWYRQNTLLFASADALASNPKLAEARAKTGDGALDMIHPAHYQRVVAWAQREQQRAEGLAAGTFARIDAG